ncbi:MAG: hypothetical protein KBC43_13555 [Bacteroidales bacterium]|nr:hypothetical protein [Bacteroidales bacterium]
MKAILLSLICFFFIFNLFSQEPIILNPVSLQSLIVTEDSLKSENKGFQYFKPFFDEDIEDIYEEWPQVNNEALIYKRNTDNFYPTLHVWYFFDKDSIVKLVYYHWGFPNTAVEATDDQLREQVSRTTEYLTKYWNVKDRLIGILGNPTQSEVSINEATYISNKIVWDFDNLRVILKMSADKKVMEINNEKVKSPIILPRSKVQIKVLMKE